MSQNHLHVNLSPIPNRNKWTDSFNKTMHWKKNWKPSKAKKGKSSQSSKRKSQPSSKNISAKSKAFRPILRKTKLNLSKKWKKFLTKWQQGTRKTKKSRKSTKKWENKSQKATAPSAFTQHKSVRLLFNAENEYSKKLNEFEKIFNSSNEKI